MEALNTEGELDADVNVARLLYELGELHRFLGRGLEVVDGEDFEAGFVDLRVGLVLMIKTC